MLHRAGITSRVNSWAGYRSRVNSTGYNDSVIANVGDIVLWACAEDIEAASGAYLPYWECRVGSLTQPTAGLQPKFDTTGWNNSSPAVMFDNVGQSLLSPVGLIDGSLTCTVAAVTRSNDSLAAVPCIAVEYGPDNNLTNGPRVGITDLGNYTVILGPDYTYRTTADVYSGVEVVGVLSVNEGNNALPPTEIPAYSIDLDPAPALSGDVSGDSVGPFGAEVFNLGSRNNGAAFPQDGATREIVILSNEITQDEVNALAFALGQKSKYRGA